MWFCTPPALATALRRRQTQGALDPNPADNLMERETGFEPATPTLARLCSTTELFPHVTHSESSTECNKRLERCQLTGAPGTSPRRYRAASSGRVGLMKKPVPHSKPATRGSLGMISRCEWK